MPAYTKPGYAPDTGTKKFYLAGSRAGLDVATEWYIDASNSTLFLYTPTGDCPANHLVEMKSRKWGFDLGTSTNIHIKGLNIFGTGIRTWDSQDSGIDGIVADYPAISRVSYSAGYDPGNVGFSGAMTTDSGIVPGGMAYNHYGRANILKNSVIKNAKTTAAFALGGEESKVVNNDIHDALMAVIANGRRFLISYNTIHDIGSNAVQDYYYNTIIEHNDISQILKDGNKDDEPFHPYGMDVGNSEWRYNRIHNFSALHYAAGLYADNGTSNLLICSIPHFNLRLDLVALA
ncbi:hypothetical protein [Paenibacillus roseipurpureus]|uniref:Uncharacterized protein n=1 Tax=Paenibacillus roseopurpureus TaxID=2918901 RepID=A0AA96RJ52_9BACL|nr:hypothetical protein [Paenibacillus sp. MBLB1832]WNR42786.1 hypothetical protein MJB10_16860 [Paenibacillus sp. MBLB1832]